MDPLNEDLSKRLKAWKVVVKRGEGHAFAKRLIDQDSADKMDLLVMRADRVFGVDHLRSALYHALKAVREGRNSSSSLPMEMMLYASGERQLGNAIDKMSVDEATEEVVVVSLSGARSIEGEAWQPLDSESRHGYTGKALLEFGVRPEELDTVDSSRQRDLILEKVAMVDILKK